LGRVFVVGATLLLADNIVVFVQNQTGTEFTDDDRLQIRPRSIAKVAKASHMTIVNTTFATYHLMREQIAGKHLLVPVDLADHRFGLERVARVSLEVAPTRLELPREVAQRIFDGETTHLWAFEPGTFTGAVLSRSASRYVLVWRAGDDGVQVVISEERYKRELDALARGKP
jgi:hypothetical protein